jgi:hypothetical protein
MRNSRIVFELGETLLYFKGFMKKIHPSPKAGKSVRWFSDQSRAGGNYQQDGLETGKFLVKPAWIPQLISDYSAPALAD